MLLTKPICEPHSCKQKWQTCHVNSQTHLLRFAFLKLEFGIWRSVS